MSYSEYWHGFMAKRLSRRTMLKGGAAVGAGLAIGSTLGCGDGKQEARKAASVEPKYGGTLSMPAIQDPPSLDPHVTSSFATIGMISPVYNRLVKYKTGADVDPHVVELIPDLAEKWEILDDVTYIFHLRKGVKWQNKPPVNGRELTAEDVKFSLQRMGTPKPEFHAQYMVEEIAKLETPDPYTVKITLKNPFAPFLTFMGSHYSWIVAKEIVDKDGDVKKTIVGTGPFMLQEYERNVKAVYKKHPGYFVKGRPYLDEIIYYFLPEVTNRAAAFRTKQVDLMGIDQGEEWPVAEEIKKSTPEAIVDEKFTRSAKQIGLQLSKAPWNDVRFRRAVSLGLDRQAMIDTLMFGKGRICGNVANGFGGGWALEGNDLGEYYKRDVPRAKRLMAEAGYGSGYKAELILTGNYGPLIVNTGVMIKDQLKEIGIDVEIRQLEYAAMMTNIYAVSQKDMYVNGISGRSEIDEVVYGWFYSTSSRNLTGTKDPKLDELLVKQRRTINEADRKKQVLDIQRYLNDNIYFVGLYTNTDFGMWYPYVKNFRHHTFASYALFMFQDVWLDK